MIRKIYRYLLYICIRKRKLATKRHHLISQKRLSNGLIITAIEPYAILHTHRDGVDIGYHKYGNDWWYNRKCPYAFQYLKLDDLYPSEYFNSKIGHPTSEIALDLYTYMQKIFRLVFERSFDSILELGSGRGEITSQFYKNNVDFVTVEGTRCGVAKLLEVGIPKDRIIFQDLKFMQPLGRKFDIVMCTEVIEHVEVFFTSKIIENCILHSDVVWFSAADKNRKAHYHHMNEQDIEAFDNLFAHVGFKRFIILDGRHNRASRIYFSDNIILSCED